MSLSESKENLTSSQESVTSNQAEEGDTADEEDDPLLQPPQPSDVALSILEKRFLLYAERGDCPSIQKIIDEHKEDPEFDINCKDPLNRTALISAIENENLDLMRILIENGIRVQDALLHAIQEEYVEAVEILLEYEEATHEEGKPYSWEQVDFTASTFTPDITPLILAAHMNNYEIIKILLDRGASLPAPHDVRCGCDECIRSSSRDSLRHSQARQNAYRALSSPSLIALSARDPILRAFELSWELRRLSRMENEFRDEYNEMREQVQNFTTSLLDHIRTSSELDTILNFDPNMDFSKPQEKNNLSRLKLAVKYKQKKFVAHPNVQQLLGSIWYDGLPGFRRKDMVHQLIEVGKLGAMFPVYSTMYLMAPNSPMAQLMTKPFVKFICHSASYMFFLMLLGAASQRVEYLAIEWFGPDWMQEILADWKRRERGSLPGIVESGVMLYVFSIVTWEMRSIWNDGFMEYISNMWNLIDFGCNWFYVNWIMLRGASIAVAWREWYDGWDPYYPREYWHPFDPMLISEGMFAAGMILSFLKLVHIFSVNPHLGPLQISLGRMIIDIVKFLIIYMLVLFAFGCGMNKLLWYYAELEKNKCYHTPDDLPDFTNEDMACTIWRRFANMFETSQSLFWASFGMVDLMAFELTGIKSFTRFWALLMFGSYSVINIIVLLNMLIAMMSNSYQIISERSDTEWKFARSNLWISYFEDGDVVPVPFNLVPSVAIFAKKTSKPTGSVKAKSRGRMIEKHEAVLRLMVKRYVMAEQSRRDDFGITEDDVLEVRQDISSMRYVLIDILRKNGMKTPDREDDSALAGKKGKIMERRLLKDFQIGYVEGVINETLTKEKESTDVFSRIAKAIGKRPSEKKDWNAEAKSRDSRRNPIGSTSEVVERRYTRQSLRRYILENKKSDMHDLDPNKLVQYNPKLSDVSPAARVAYTRFKMSKIQEEYDLEEKECGDVFKSSRPALSISAISAASKYGRIIHKAQPIREANQNVVIQIDTPETETTAPSSSAIELAALQAPSTSCVPETPSTAPAPETTAASDTASPPESTPDSPTPESKREVASTSETAAEPNSGSPTDNVKGSQKKREAPKPVTPVKETSTPAPPPPPPVSSQGKSVLSGKVLEGWL